MLSVFDKCDIFCIQETWFAVQDLHVVNSSPAARGGNLAKIPPNQVIDDFGRGSSVESESV